MDSEYKANFNIKLEGLAILISKTSNKYSGKRRTVGNKI